ncbi:SDR family NAD(P)-dependent oxidoreductase [Modestobacter sp. I12A-02662]|uniref:SDR family NAD(P)-dependent oxidoreductase n=1 Tax=Modestobacter sp. I12A-02662 TaxID=1730496 RepID=UPI0034DFB94A
MNGQVAVVTGGGRGIGLAIAAHLLREGAHVVVTGRNKATLDAAVEQLGSSRVSAAVADVTQEDDVEDLFRGVVDQHGRLDVLVNNAGIAEEAAFLDISLESWERVLAVNLTGVFLTTQRAARRMTAGGSVVTIASIDAHGADGPFASYTAAKTGLLGMTRAAAAELGPRGIRINTVSPGWTLTDMAVEATSPAELERMKTAFDRVPLRRMVTVDEVAAAVTFLASPAAAGITGTDLVVDGGTVSNLYILETLAQPHATPGGTP